MKPTAAQINEFVSTLEKKTNMRDKCLTDARECVCSDRNLQYGEPEDNFARIADFWNVYLHDKRSCALQAVDVANMMCLFKLGRIASSPDGGTYDSYVDLAGYAACAAECNDNCKM